MKCRPEYLVPTYRQLLCEICRINVATEEKPIPGTVEILDESGNSAGVGIGCIRLAKVCKECAEA